MKSAISVWSFPAEWSLEKKFRTASEAGFDGVEVALDEEGEISLGSAAGDMDGIKKLAKSHNVELFSLATGLYWKYSLTSGDDAVRDKALSIAKKQLEVAKWLGCDTILVVPGCVGADFAPGQVVEYDVAYERALDAVNSLKAYAEGQGVCIGVENVWNKFLLSPLEMRDFIDAAGSPFVGAYFDVGNVLVSGYPEHWIKILGSRIKKVHFKDFKRSVGSLEGFVDILSGDVDYPAVAKSLARIGYDGWVTAEVGFSKDYPEQSVRNVANAVRSIIG